MSKILIVTGAGLGAIVLWWIVAGSSLVALVDKISTAPSGSVSPSGAVFDEGEEAVSETPTFIVDDRTESAGAWRVTENPAGHLTLETTAGRFTLGSIATREARRGGRFRYTVNADPGDIVSVERNESRVSWPRPFAINWLGGHSANWGRHVYRRMIWRKASGETLDVTWRDEKRFTQGNGWVDQYIRSEPVTSLKTKSH